MTRKKAYIECPCVKEWDDMKEFIDAMCDDFENRICENCIFYEKLEKNNYDQTYYCIKFHDAWSNGEMYQPDFGKDFGCNKWKAKC